MSACPECGTLKTRVVETRRCAEPYHTWTLRRRFCEYGCQCRWATYEMPADQVQIEAPQEGGVVGD